MVSEQLVKKMLSVSLLYHFKTLDCVTKEFLIQEEVTKDWEGILFYFTYLIFLFYS